MSGLLKVYLDKKAEKALKAITDERKKKTLIEQMKAQLPTCHLRGTNQSNADVLKIKGAEECLYRVRCGGYRVFVAMCDECVVVLGIEKRDGRTYDNVRALHARPSVLNLQQL